MATKKKLNTHGLTDERIFALSQEILLSKKLNEEELEPSIQEALERYTGRHVPQFGLDWDIVLNEVYPIIQNELPSIFFKNPRVFLKPRNKHFIAKRRNLQNGEMEEVQLDSGKSASTQEAILNYTMQEIKYKRETRKVLLDALLFPHGVMWHGYKGDFGMTEEQSIFIRNEMVFVKRIGPLRFVKDPNVPMSNIEEAKWVGRIIDIPLIDVLEDTKLHITGELSGFKGFGDLVGKATDRKKFSNIVKAAALAMMQKVGLNKTRISSLKKPLIDFADKDFQNSKSAKFIRVVEIYLRPTKREKRDGKKGWVLLLTDEQTDPLRINPWSIKAEGHPVQLLQFNELNDSMFALPDIDVYKSIADQKNIITNIQLRNAQENSKVWVGLSKDGADEEDIDAARIGNNTILRFDSDDVRKRMFVASPGGAASSELYLIDQRIQKNLEDKSGVTDLKRGFLQSGEESAASVKIRAAGGGARPAYRQDIMAEFLKSSVTYLNQMLKQFTPVKDAVRIVGSLDIEWSDNPSKEELQADVDVEIDVISMLPENPEKELREFNTVLALMVDALRDPTIRRKLQEEGKTLNLAPVIEQILLRLKTKDPEIFRNIKPEESQGFVSVQQLREAQGNIEAALSGKQIPFPPKPEDDHVAKIETYSSTQKILQALGQVSDTLEQLVKVQSALLQQIQEKQDRTGKSVTPQLKRPIVQQVGT